jgi:hypothetical protein
MRELERRGLREYHIRQNGHIVITGRIHDHHFQWVISSTPSDVNAPLRQIADLKRELRRCGASDWCEAISFVSLGDSGGTDFAAVWDTIREWEAAVRDP